jgi:phosphoglycerate dehydrogenase-like enzyme
VPAPALTPATTGIVGKAELAAMRTDAWLVNVARGPHVDTAALVEALRGQAIGGAALDVTDRRCTGSSTARPGRSAAR